METARDALSSLIGILWGDQTFALLLGLGVVLTIWTRAVQLRSLTHGVGVLRGHYDDPDDPGAISHFQALSAALSGTVGLGNIGGVALAVGIGGPGALFWMWVAGALGMAIKAVEVTLAMLYRDVSDPRRPHGGAMYVAKNAFANSGVLGRAGGRVLAVAFCLTLLVSSLTGGNMFQAWNVANVTQGYFGVPSWAVGVVLAAATALVIVGGIRRIGVVAGALVPFMCGSYLIAGLIVLAINAEQLPGLFAEVLRAAWSGREAEGAFLGATAWFALTTGVRRALFSNEAGQGSSPIAHAAARDREPVREGVVAGLEPFLDTCLVCTLTAMVILTTGVWNRGPIAELPNGTTAARLAALDDPNALPPSDTGGWKAGDGVFVVARVLSDGEQQRVAIRGEVFATAEAGLVLAWEPPPEATVEVERPVFRQFTGARLTAHAFDSAVPGLGRWLVTFVCWLFAFSTMVSWSYYGEQGVVFLFGRSGVLPYKVVFCAATVVATLPGVVETDEDLGNLADVGTGLMLMTNVPIVVLLAHRAIAELRDYFRRLRTGAVRRTR